MQGYPNNQNNQFRGNQDNNIDDRRFAQINSDQLGNNFSQQPNVPSQSFKMQNNRFEDQQNQMMSQQPISRGSQNQLQGAQLQTGGVKLAQTLQQIGQVVKQLQIQSLCAYMGAYMYDGCMVLKLPQFIKFLSPRQPFSLTYDQAVEVATTFPVKLQQQKWQITQENLVDIQSFENAVFQQVSNDQQEKQRYQQIYDSNKMGYLLLNRMVKLFDDYMMDFGFDVFSLFKQIDKDRSNQLDAQELLQALKSAGGKDFTLEDCQRLITMMDTNHNGSIDYYEFAEAISNSANSKAIQDPRHWAFDIFESLRRSLDFQKKSMLQIFGVVNFKRQKQDEPIYVQWTSFIQVVKQVLGVMVSRQQEDQLFKMLESSVQKGSVDLNEFQQYLGSSTEKINNDIYQKSYQIQQDLIKVSNSKQDNYFKNKQLVQQILKKLDELQITKNQLRYEFQQQVFREQKNQNKNLTLLSKQAFLDTVELLCNQNSNNQYKNTQIDPQAFNALLQIFVNKNQMIDYEQFINMFESYEKIEITLSYFIQHLHSYIEQNQQQFQTIKECIQNIGKLPAEKIKLYQQEFSEILKKIQIYLSPQEINIIFDQFDTSGSAQQIDLRDLDKYYQSIQSQDQKTQINPQQPNFSKPFQLALKKYQAELREIIDLIQDRKSGTNQWFRMQSISRSQAIQQNKLIYQDFEHAITQLGSRNLNQAVLQDIFQLLTGGMNNQLDINEFDELLQYIKYQPLNQRQNEESTMISIIQSVNGDDLYLTERIKIIDKDKKGLSTNQFISLIKSLNSQFTPIEIDVLIKRFVSLDKYNPSGVDTVSFINEFKRLRDLRAIKKGIFNDKMPGANNKLSDDDQKFLDGISQTIKKSKVFDKLIEGLKYKDHEDKGYITIVDLDNVLSSLPLEGKKEGLKLGSKQLANLSKFLKFNRNDQFEIYQFVELLFGKDQAELLYKPDGILKKGKKLDPTAVGQASRILNDKELDECKIQILKIKQLADAQRISLKTVFERSKRNPKEENFSGEEFVEILKNQINIKMVQEIKIQENLQNLVLYLAEKDASTISYNKLLLALTRQSQDQPLKQGLTKIQEEYNANIKESVKKAKDENEIQNLINFMAKNNWGIKDILPNTAKPQCSEILVTQFNQGLQYIKYVPNDSALLLNSLLIKGDEKLVNIDILRKKFNQVKTKPDMPQNRLMKLPLNVQQSVQKIQAYLVRQDMSNEEFHKYLDVDKNGDVDKREFVQSMSNLRIPGINPQDLNQVFDQLDANDDGTLSVNELSLYLQGAKKQINDKRKNMDPEMLKQMKDEISQLFNTFDENGDGKVDAGEIFMTLQSFGIQRSKQQCQQMVSEASNGGDSLNQKQFSDLMMPIMQDAIEAQSQLTEDLRSLFLEADTDYSGFLSVGELYNIFKKIGADVTEDDIIELMTEIDVDRNGELDIDEFISLMTVGDQINFKNQNSKRTYNLIQKSRRISPIDFVKAFKNMPSNFVPSFVSELWKQKKNLPSSSFKVQVDPLTMLWKDVRPLRSDLDLKQLNLKDIEKPFLRPIETSIGCLITLKSASGVPLPLVGNPSSNFKDENIVKRCLRVAILNCPAKYYEVVHNCIQSPAEWNPKDEDIWNFNSSEQQLSEIIFRTTKQDKLDKTNTKIVFEFVVCVKQDKDSETLIEMSCGWSEILIEDLSRNQVHKLEIKGGTPTAQIDIKKDELRTKRTGLKMFQKVLVGVEQKLEIETKNYTNLPAEIKYHMNLMPSTCLVHKNLLYFTSGFINYKAKKILTEQELGKFKKPSGDPILSSFPNIYDNPDIMQELTKIWMEDVNPKINEGLQKDIKYLMQRSKDFIARLYPILYSDEFKSLRFKGSTNSACGDSKALEQRKKLVQIALRSGQTYFTKVKKPTESTSELTNFTPFSVKELELDVWDTSRTKQDRFLDRM